ncbi:helix-turn-helix domain-containing protein [Nocardia sp. CA-135398]|uniref:helix-turn-helix domain-containing protein n=1 Tax=Nocardia sp. CA-135398 TaxID=3239977 RepID=UPI003D997D4F
MDGLWSLNPVVELRKAFEELPPGVRRPIVVLVFGGELPRADVSGMRWMAAELRAKAAAMNAHAEDAEKLLAQEDSLGALGDRVREVLHLHREGAVRLREEALALADQAHAAANDAEKTLCVMFVFGIELAWRIIRMVAVAAAAGPAGEVAAAPMVESMLVEGRAKVALMRAGLEKAYKVGAAKTAARLSALGPHRFALAVGTAAALPAGVDLGVQLMQVGSGDRISTVKGPNGENPMGIDLKSIEAAGVSGAGGAVGGMGAGVFAPKVVPALATGRAALGLVQGVAGAVSGLGAAALITGWPENSEDVLTSLLNGGFAGVVDVHGGAHSNPGSAIGEVVDGSGAYVPPDPSTVSLSKDAVMRLAGAPQETKSLTPAPVDGNGGTTPQLANSAAPGQATALLGGHLVSEGSPGATGDRQHEPDGSGDLPRRLADAGSGAQAPAPDEDANKRAAADGRPGEPDSPARQGDHAAADHGDERSGGGAQTGGDVQGAGGATQTGDRAHGGDGQQDGADARGGGAQAGGANDARTGDRGQAGSGGGAHAGDGQTGGGGHGAGSGGNAQASGGVHGGGDGAQAGSVVASGALLAGAGDDHSGSKPQQSASHGEGNAHSVGVGRSASAPAGDGAAGHESAAPRSGPGAAKVDSPVEMGNASGRHGAGGEGPARVTAPKQVDVPPAHEPSAVEHTKDAVPADARPSVYDRPDHPAEALAQELAGLPSADPAIRRDLTAEQQTQFKAAAKKALALYRLRQEELSGETWEQRRHTMEQGDRVESLLRYIDAVREGTGMTPRWNQIKAFLLGEHGFMRQMGTGQGKSMVGALDTLWQLSRGEPVELASGESARVHHVITTTEVLANEGVREFAPMLRSLGYEVARWDPHSPPGEVDRPTVYYMTYDERATAELFDRPPPGKTATIDEADAVLVHNQTVHYQSEGQRELASEVEAAGVYRVRDFLKAVLRSRITAAKDLSVHFEQALHDGPLTAEEAGAVRALSPEEVGAARTLTARSLREQPEQCLDTVSRLWESYAGRKFTAEETEMARAFLDVKAGRLKLNRDFQIFGHDAEKKVQILDEYGKPRSDPKIGTESRWFGGRHKMVEAMFGAPVYSDGKGSKQVTVEDVLGGYEKLHLMSGTLERTAAEIKENFPVQGGLAKVEDFGRSKLVGEQDRIFLTEPEKLRDAVSRVQQLQAEGRPVLVICPFNDLARKFSLMLTKADVEHTAIDGQWFAAHRDNNAAEEHLLSVKDTAGARGAVTVGTGMLGRGFDVSISDEVNQLGGVHAHMLGRSPTNPDEDHQRSARAGRNGRNGSFCFSVAASDRLYSEAQHHGARVAITHYRAAVAKHAEATAQYTEAARQAGNTNAAQPEEAVRAARTKVAATAADVAAAEREMRSLTSPLQNDAADRAYLQRAMRRANLAHAPPTAGDPAASSATSLQSTIAAGLPNAGPDTAAGVGQTESATSYAGADSDRAPTEAVSAEPAAVQPHLSGDRFARLAGWLGIPASVQAAAAVFDTDNDDDPLSRLMERAGISSAAVEALNQHLDHAPPVTVMQTDALSDEQALNHLRPQRNRLAAELGWEPAQVAGAEGVRQVGAAVDTARIELATLLDVPATEVNAATARDVLADAVARLLGDTETADDPATELRVFAASAFLAVTALLDLAVAIHQRSPKSCVNNGVTMMRVLYPDNEHAYRMPADMPLRGHNEEDTERAFGGAFRTFASLDETAESLKQWPGGSQALVYKWVNKGQVESHLVLLVNDSERADEPNLVVLDIAAAPGEAPITPADLAKPRALLNKAVPFEQWQREQQPYIDLLDEADRDVLAIEFDSAGEPLDRLSTTQRPVVSAQDPSSPPPSLWSSRAPPLRRNEFALAGHRPLGDGLSPDGSVPAESRQSAQQPRRNPLEQTLESVRSIDCDPAVASDAERFVMRCYEEYRQRIKENDRIIRQEVLESIQAMAPEHAAREALAYVDQPEIRASINRRAADSTRRLIHNIERRAKQKQTNLPDRLAHLYRIGATAEDAKGVPWQSTKKATPTPRPTPTGQDKPGNRIGSRPPDYTPEPVARQSFEEDPAARDEPSMPDPVRATHQELTVWAAQLSDRELQRFLAEKQAEASAHVAAVHRGRPPAVNMAIGTARAQIALATERWQRLTDSSTEASITEARTAADAATAVFHIIGALPMTAALPSAFADDPDGLLDLLTRFPERLLVAAELDQAAGVDAADWAEVADALLTEHRGGDWDSELIRALRSLPVKAAEFTRALTGSDRDFGASATQYIPDAYHAALYFLTRTRDVEQAVARLRDVDHAVAAAMDRLGSSRPATDAGLSLLQLRIDIHETMAYAAAAIASKMRASTLLGLEQNPLLPQMVARVVDDLDTMARHGSETPRPLRPAYTAHPVTSEEPFTDDDYREAIGSNFQPRVLGAHDGQFRTVQGTSFEPLRTGTAGISFVMDRWGRMVGESEHAHLMHVLAAMGDEAAGWGVVYTDEDGRPVGQLYPYALGGLSDPMCTTQLRDVLMRGGFDLTDTHFNNESLGRLWQGELPSLPDLFTMRKWGLLNSIVATFDAYDDGFWVRTDSETITQSPDEVRVPLTLGPLRRAPGHLDVVVYRAGEHIIVQYRDCDPGAEPEQVARVFKAFHERMTRWVSESDGVMFHPDTDDVVVTFEESAPDFIGSRPGVSDGDRRDEIDDNGATPWSRQQESPSPEQTQPIVWPDPGEVKPFGRWLEAARNSRGISRSELAARMGVPGSATYIGSFERGVKPTREMVVRILDALDAPADVAEAVLRETFTAEIENLPDPADPKFPHPNAWLVAARKRRKMSQKELAAHVGLSVTQWAPRERATNPRTRAYQITREQAQRALEALAATDEVASVFMQRFYPDATSETAPPNSGRGNPPDLIGSRPRDDETPLAPLDAGRIGSSRDTESDGPTSFIGNRPSDSAPGQPLNVFSPDMSVADVRAAVAQALSDRDADGASAEFPSQLPDVAAMPVQYARTALPDRADTDHGIDHDTAQETPDVVRTQAMRGRPGVTIELMTFDDGVQVLRETYAYADHAMQEWAKALIGRVMGAPIAEVRLSPPEYHVLYRDYQYEGARRDPSASDMLGIFAAITGKKSPFAAAFVRHVDGRSVWQDHHLGRQDIVDIGLQVDRLGDELEQLVFPGSLSRTVLDTQMAAMRALRELARHAEHPLRMAGLDDQARAKARVVEDFVLDHPYLELAGFDSPHVPVATVGEILGKLDDLLGRYRYTPGFQKLMTNIRTLRIDFLFGSRAEAEPEQDKHGPHGEISTVRTELTFSLQYAADRDEARADDNRRLQYGTHPSSGQPYADDVCHEFAHAIDQATGWELSRNLPTVLRNAHAKLKEHGLIESYAEWLNRLPSYAFTNSAKTTLKEREAIAVGFADAEINGIVVGTPQWVIHEYLTKLRPPEVFSAQPTTHRPDGPEGLIGSRPSDGPIDGAARVDETGTDSTVARRNAGLEDYHDGPAERRTPPGARFAELIDDGLDAGVARTDSLPGAPGVKCELVTFGNGYQAVRETYDAAVNATVEWLKSSIGGAMGAPVADTCLQPGDYTVLYRELIAGRPADMVLPQSSARAYDLGLVHDDLSQQERELAAALGPLDRRYLDAAPGDLLGLFDAATETRRSTRHWSVGPDGTVLAGRGATTAEDSGPSPFAAKFVQRVDGRAVWRDHHLPRRDITAIREQVSYVGELVEERLADLPETHRKLLHKTHQRALAALARVEQHAVHTTEETSHVSGLSADAQAKARLVEQFTLNHPYFAIAGLEHPLVLVEAAREILQTLDELLTKYHYTPRFRRLMTNIRGLRFDFLDDPDINAETVPGGRDRTQWMTFNMRRAANRAQAIEDDSEDSATGYHPSSGHPYHDDVVHEFAHAIDHATGMRLSANIESVLHDAWEALRRHGMIAEPYDAWLRHLPEAAFTSTTKETLAPRETVAVGFFDVEINGPVVGTPQWVVHHYVSTLRPPEVGSGPAASHDAPESRGTDADSMDGYIGSRPMSDPGDRSDQDVAGVVEVGDLTDEQVLGHALVSEQLLLTQENAVALSDALTERDQAVDRITGQVRQLEHALATLVGESGTVDMVSLTGVRDELNAFLDQRLAAYAETPEGRRDQMIATLRAISAKPRLDESDIRVITEIVPVKQSGFAALLPGAKDRYAEVLHTAARVRLAELDSHRVEASRADDAIRRLQRGVRAQLDRAAELFDDHGSRRTVQGLLDDIDSMRSEISAARRDMSAGWHDVPDNGLAPLLSEIARGLRTRDDVVDAVVAIAAPRRITVIVDDLLRMVERSAVSIFAECSMRGFVFGDHEARNVRALADAIARVRTMVGIPEASSDLYTRVVDKSAEYRSDFGSYVDQADTLYLHFTPNIHAIATAGMIRSGAHDEVINTTAAHSVGVHFIKPGDWQGTENFNMYVGYAGLRRTLEPGNSTVLPDPLGAIVVMPLGAIMKTTPIRNEAKTTAPDEAHLASDATFRPLDGNPRYAYSLDDAYIIPCYSNLQVSREERLIIDPDTGERSVRPVSEPIRDAFRRAGYDEAWIDRHVIELPERIAADPDTRMLYGEYDRTQRLIRQAQDEIKRRMAEDGTYTDRLVVPLTTEHGRQFETLDIHGTTPPGNPSVPALERLIVTDRHAPASDAEKPQIKRTPWNRSGRPDGAPDQQEQRTRPRGPGGLIGSRPSSEPGGGAALPVEDSTTHGEPARPDAVGATREELAHWATQLSDHGLRTFLTQTQTETSAYIADLHRGQPPALEAAIAAARVQTALVIEQLHRSAAGGSGSLLAAADAASNVFEIIGALRVADTRSVSDRHDLDILTRFPERLRAVAELGAARFVDGSDWARLVDAYLVAGRDNDWDQEVIQSLRSLPVQAAEFVAALTGSDRTFGDVASRFIPNAYRAAMYYLTRSHDTDQAIDRLRELDHAVAAAVDRLGSTRAATEAGLSLLQLRMDIHAAIASADGAIAPAMRSSAMQGLDHNPLLPQMIERIVLDLGALARHGSETPRPIRPTYTARPIAVQDLLGAYDEDYFPVLEALAFAVHDGNFIKSTGPSSELLRTGSKGVSFVMDQWGRFLAAIHHNSLVHLILAMGVDLAGWGTLFTDRYGRLDDPVRPYGVDGVFDPMGTAQLRDALTRRGLRLDDTTFDNASQGKLWHLDSTPVSALFTMKPLGVLGSIESMFAVYDDGFWIKPVRGGTTCSADEVRVPLILGPLRHEPGNIEVAVYQQGDRTIVQYRDPDPGLDPDRVAPVFAELHQRMNRWVAESEGAEWHPDTAQAVHTFERHLERSAPEQDQPDGYIGSRPTDSTPGSNDPTRYSSAVLAPDTPAPQVRTSLAESLTSLGLVTTSAELPTELLDVAASLVNYGLAAAGGDSVKVSISSRDNDDGFTVGGMRSGTTIVRARRALESELLGKGFGTFEWRGRRGETDSWSVHLWGDRNSIGHVDAAQLAGLATGFDVGRVSSAVSTAVGRATRRWGGLKRTGALAVEVHDGQLRVRMLGTTPLDGVAYEPPTLFDETIRPPGTDRPGGFIGSRPSESAETDGRFAELARNRAEAAAELRAAARQFGEQPPARGAEAAAIEAWRHGQKSSAATIAALTGTNPSLVTTQISEVLNLLHRRLTALTQPEWDRLLSNAGQQLLTALGPWIGRSLELEDDLQRATILAHEGTPDNALNHSNGERRTQRSRDLDDMLGRSAISGDVAADADLDLPQALERLAASAAQPPTGRLLNALLDHLRFARLIQLTTTWMELDGYITKNFGRFETSEQSGDSAQEEDRPSESIANHPPDQLTFTRPAYEQGPRGFIGTKPPERPEQQEPAQKDRQPTPWSRSGNRAAASDPADSTHRPEPSGATPWSRPTDSSGSATNLAPFDRGVKVPLHDLPGPADPEFPHPNTWIAAARKRRKMSQKDLAAHVGLSLTQWAVKERATNPRTKEFQVTLEQAQRALEVLAVPADIATAFLQRFYPDAAAEPGADDPGPHDRPVS